MIKFGRLNTLRNQIFIGFMLVMVIVLASVGIITYNQVSVLLRNSAEKHIQQTAVQATGKLDALLQQISTLTAQVSTNASIQRLLAREMDGEGLSFPERQFVQQESRKYEGYIMGIRSLEIYRSDYRKVIDDIRLNSRVSEQWINQVDEGRGSLIWLGLDPQDSDVIIAIRQIRLIDRSFSSAGYVMVRIDKNYFQLEDTVQGKGDTRETMGLFDGAGQVISSDFPSTVDTQAILEQPNENVIVDEEEYMAIQQKSESTGWTLVILTPVHYTAEGISVLRTAIIVSGIVGGLLFLVFTLILSTMITRPILNMIKVMRGARFGTLKHNPNTSSTMEINELNNTYNQMVDSLNELIEVVYQKEIVQSRTELKALQAQINPHFLFNTLEAFYWALEDKGEEELAQIVVAMSGLFRYVINRSDDDEWVTIGDELSHVERYLKIMEMRMVDRLSWRIESEETHRGVPLPKLLIQPLVENAILHGVEQRVGPGTVIVRVEVSDRPGHTMITVIDDGPGMDAATIQSLYAAMEDGRVHSSKRSGIGMVNVERRLKLYYESKARGLDIQSKEGQGTTIIFEIPDGYGGHIRDEDHTNR